METYSHTHSLAFIKYKTQCYQLNHSPNIQIAQRVQVCFYNTVITDRWVNDIHDAPGLEYKEKKGCYGLYKNGLHKVCFFLVMQRCERRSHSNETVHWLSLSLFLPCFGVIIFRIILILFSSSKFFTDPFKFGHTLISHQLETHGESSHT